MAEVTWATVAIAVVPGLVGGVIGAGSALIAGAQVERRETRAKLAEANRGRANKREEALMAAMKAVQETHTATLGHARRVSQARKEPDTPRLDEALSTFGEAHLAAVRAQEHLRLLSRSVAVQTAVETVRQENGKVYDYANDNRPPQYKLSAGSVAMRNELRTLADAVQAECDNLWTAANNGQTVRG